MSFETWWALLLWAEFLMQLFVVSLVIMRGSRRSATSLAWILVIMFLPIFGMVSWFMVGEARIGSRRRRRYAELAERIVTVAKSLGPMDDHRSDPPGYEVAIALAEAVGGTPPRGGHTLELMGDTKQVIDSLAVDIDAAQETCNLLFYIYLDDGSGRQVAQALKGAARRGVQCRLLVDDVGSKKFLKSRLCESLREAGVRVVGALPAHLLRAAFARIDLRNHRKLAVIDGVIGYTGSQNIADASFAPKPMFAPWVDCMLRIQGPVVWDLQTIFVCDWFLDTGEPIESLLSKDTGEVDAGVTVQILPTGPANDNEALQQLALSAFHHAREELILTTPYFVPGEAEVTSLCTAAKRGVRVSLVLPARNDSWLVGAVSRSHYGQLVASGVAVFEYQEGLLHSKTLTVDRNLAMVTTANFDQRSFDLNFEVSTLVYDSDFASQLRFMQRSYIEDSVRVREDWIRGRSWPKRLFENAAGVFSPLL